VDDETLNPELYNERRCLPEPADCDDPFIRHFITGMWIFAGLWCIGFTIACLIAGRAI
jgi:hypothetical protein